MYAAAMGNTITAAFVVCAFIIRLRIWRNSAISISSAGLGDISFSRIRFCRKSFAFATIPRNRLGSRPLLLIDWLALEVEISEEINESGYRWLVK